LRNDQFNRKSNKEDDSSDEDADGPVDRSKLKDQLVDFNDMCNKVTDIEKRLQKLANELSGVDLRDMLL